MTQTPVHLQGREAEASSVPAIGDVGDDVDADAPYIFACHPNEWPYDLEARHGTPDYDRIVAWFLDKHPQLDAAAVADFQQLFLRLSPGKVVTVQVHVDPEYDYMTLCFLVYGFEHEGWPDTKMEEDFFVALEDRPDLRALSGHLLMATEPEEFGAEERA